MTQTSVEVYDPVIGKRWDCLHLLTALRINYPLPGRVADVIHKLRSWNGYVPATNSLLIITGLTEAILGEVISPGWEFEVKEVYNNLEFVQLISKRRKE